MKHSPIRVGLVGYGFAGKTFHAPVIHSVSGLLLSAVSSIDAAKVHADWPGMAVDAHAHLLLERPEIDLVVIATPNETHFSLARDALAAGKHVVVDKPFTLTVAQAQELQQCARRAGRVLSVFHNRRWDADFLTLQHVLASGALGEVMHLESHFDRYRPEVRARWREQGTLGGGLWYDLGPHLLDQVVQLWGMPQSITLDMAQQRAGAQATDWFHAVLRYGERRAVLHASALMAAATPRFAVHGTLGSWVKFGLDPQEDALRAGQRPPAISEEPAAHADEPTHASMAWGADPLPAHWSVWRDGALVQTEQPCLPGNYGAYYAGIRDAVRGVAANPVTPEQAIDVMRLIEAGLQSASEARAVPLALPPTATAPIASTSPAPLPTTPSASLYPGGCAFADGAYGPLERAQVSVFDWGFSRSDATYDVVSTWRGSFFRLDDHLDRFFASLEKMRMTLPYSRAQLREILHGCVRASGLQDSYVAMICTRGVPPKGARDPRLAQNRFYAYALPYVWIASREKQLQGIDLHVSKRIRIAPESVDPTVKNYHWMDLVQSLFDAYDQGRDTSCVVDAYGHVMEGPGFNVFMVKDSVVYTPERGVLEGVSRRTAMELCHRLGLELRVQPVPVAQFRAADEVFLTSTGGGILPIARLDGQPLPQFPGPVSERLLAAYWAMHEEPAFSDPVSYD